MVERRWGAGMPWAEQIALGSGIAFVVLAVIAFALAAGPDSDASRDEIVSYFADNTDAVKCQAALFGLAAAFFLWFGGSVAAALRRAEGDPAGRLPAIVVAAVGASAALYLAGSSAWAALASAAGDDGASSELFHLGETAFGLSSFTAAAFVWALSTGAMRTRLYADWIGWLGALLTLLLVVNGFVQTFDDEGRDILGTITFLAFLAWVLIVSGLLTLGVRRTAPGTPVTRAP